MRTLLLVTGIFFLYSCRVIQPLKQRDAVADFEQYWNTLNKAYPFFDIKRVDWDSMYRVYRPQVHKAMPEKELVRVLGALSTPLADGHITISSGSSVLFKGTHESTFRAAFKGKEEPFWQMVHENLLSNGFVQPQPVGPVFRNEAQFYYSHAPTQAYIRITRCFGTTESLFDEQVEAAELKAMLQTWDSLLALSAGKQQLIIDLRSNGGGYGGTEMAQRFVQSPTLTHFISTRDSNGHFGPATAVYLNPLPKPYTGKILVLTSDRTASSAEDFCLALAALPQATLIGTPTAGMFSDMKEGSLSQGLSYTYSYQRYTNKEGTVLEGKGVPVHYPVANTANNLVDGKDPVLLKAFSLQ